MEYFILIHNRMQKTNFKTLNIVAPKEPHICRLFIIIQNTGLDFGSEFLEGYKLDTQPRLEDLGFQFIKDFFKSWELTANWALKDMPELNEAEIIHGTSWDSWPKLAKCADFTILKVYVSHLPCLYKSALESIEKELKEAQSEDALIDFIPAIIDAMYQICSCTKEYGGNKCWVDIIHIIRSFLDVNWSKEVISEHTQHMLNEEAIITDDFQLIAMRNYIHYAYFQVELIS